MILQHDNARLRVAKRVKTDLETLKWKLYLNRCIYQTLTHIIIPCSNRWHKGGQSSTFILMKIPNNGLARGLPQKTCSFSEVEFQ